MNSSIRHSTFFIRHLAASLLLAPCSPLPAAPPPELTVLRMQYEKLLAERVSAPFEASKGALDTKFTAALSNAANAAKQAGKLEEVLAIQDDQKRLTDKLPLPDDTDTTPEALKRLRAIYREQLGKLEAQRTANHGTILPAYTARLQELETTLTKADRIDEAKELKLYRESLTQGGPPSPPGGSPEPAQGTTARTAMPPDEVPSVKGDDRVAAELVLRLRGKVKLVGSADYTASADALPKKRFALQEINLSTNGQGVLEPADAEQLNGLQQLTAFVINNSVKVDDALRFLRTCPNLVRVHVENCGSLTGAWLNYAAPLKKLEALVVVSGAKSDTTGINGFLTESLLSVTLRDCPADDATLAALARSKKLRGLYLRDSKVTDAGMAYLAGLKELVSLNVTDTPVTMEGMKALGKPSLLTLGFGKDPEDTAAALPQLGVQFPKVETFLVPGAPSAGTAAQVAAIGTAWPKLKKLDFPSYMSFEDNAFDEAGRLFPELNYLYLWQDKVTDQHLQGISQMKKLAKLNLEGSKVSDAGLASLEKIKSLKNVNLRGTAVTDAALAAFKTARPDVKVEK